MSADPPTSKAHPAMWVFCVLVLVYFLFPHLFLWPLVKTGLDETAGPAVRVLFSPINYLYDHFPAYRALMEAESNWTGIR